MRTLERTGTVRPRTRRTALIHSFRRLVGRMGAVYAEGQRTHGPGAVLQWDMGHTLAPME